MLGQGNSFEFFHRSLTSHAVVDNLGRELYGAGSFDDHCVIVPITIHQVYSRIIVKSIPLEFRHESRKGERHLVRTHYWLVHLHLADAYRDLER